MSNEVSSFDSVRHVSVYDTSGNYVSSFQVRRISELENDDVEYRTVKVSNIKNEFSEWKTCYKELARSYSPISWVTEICLDLHGKDFNIRGVRQFNNAVVVNGPW